MANLNITPTILKEFEKQAFDVVKFNKIEEAKYFVDKIWPDVESSNLESTSKVAYARMQKLLKMNQILLLHTLPDDEFVSFFEDGIEVYFTDMIDDFDLWQVIKGKLVTVYNLDDRDILKERVRKAMLNNKNQISKEKISRNGREYNPTVRQWLLDYTSVVGLGLVDMVKVNEYFSANKNFQGLSEEEKGSVRSMITLYEFLKRSSYTPEGLEETAVMSDDDKTYVMSDGRIEDLDPRIKEMLKKLSQDDLSVGTGEEFEAPQGAAKVPTTEEQAIVEAYKGNPKIVKAISKEEQKIVSKFGSNNSRLRAEFFLAVQKKDVIRVIALLRVMAQKKDLESFISEDKKLNRFLTQIWEKQYGDEFVKEFNKDPASPKFVKIFLRYVLEQRLGLNSNDAARIGLQIANIFVSQGKKSYNKMAYFDVKSKTFNWIE